MAVPMVVATAALLETELKVSEKVSFASLAVSPATSTVTVVEVAPAGMVPANETGFTPPKSAASAEADAKCAGKRNLALGPAAALHRERIGRDAGVALVVGDVDRRGRESDHLTAGSRARHPDVVDADPLVIAGGIRGHDADLKGRLDR